MTEKEKQEIIELYKFYNLIFNYVYKKNMSSQTIEQLKARAFDLLITRDKIDNEYKRVINSINNYNGQVSKEVSSPPKEEKEPATTPNTEAQEEQKS